MQLIHDNNYQLCVPQTVIYNVIYDQFSVQGQVKFTEKLQYFMLQKTVVNFGENKPAGGLRVVKHMLSRNKTKTCVFYSSVFLAKNVNVCHLFYLCTAELACPLLCICYIFTSQPSRV